MLRHCRPALVLALSLPLSAAVLPAVKSNPQPDTVLLDTMQAELTRAMRELGTTAQPAAKPATAQPAPPPAPGAGPLDDALGSLPASSPRPYFLSYAVADADQFSMSASFGALTGQHTARVRNADVQVRLGSPAEDNTHGDHRNSAISSVPMPLSDDRVALARSLWFATNRGYARALDAWLKVQTEQQVRAKEEDTSADFSVEHLSLIHI